jgi:hypothetical protein
MLSPASVEIESMEMRLLAPQPVSGHWNDDSVIPSVVREVFIVNFDRGNTRGNIGDVDEFGVDGGRSVSREPDIGEGLVIAVKDNW